ncbi:hypothetical protein G9A89_003493 [Geosiphon pyriformis]|nr:hypothetical protein G9A89_003493 [Geosiphon pyriformis]
MTQIWSNFLLNFYTTNNLDNITTADLPESIILNYETSRALAEELLEIFNKGNSRWQYDEVILVDVKKWLDTNNHCPETVFLSVYNERERIEFACLLAFMYLYGVGTTPNNISAFTWYKTAAEAGDLLGQNELGSCLKMGAGTKQDDQQAFHWYLKSATGGFPVAQYKIGWAYFNGRGTERDLNLAFYWFNISARAGFGDAHDHLAFCYQTGKGVKKNLRKAIYWYQKASDSGNSSSSKKLARYYKYGYGVPRDMHMAIRNYIRAEPSDSLIARFDLRKFFWNVT